jgi:hypothetical protein
LWDLVKENTPQPALNDDTARGTEISLRGVDLRIHRIIQVRLLLVDQAVETLA